MGINPYDPLGGRVRTFAETTRRQFLLIMGTLASLGAVLFGGVEVLRFMFPVASDNAPALFKTAFTFEALTGGVVNGKAVTPVNVLSETDKRVTVVLDDAGIYAVLLICTHLGCTPNYVTDVTTGSGVSATVADQRGVRTKPQQIPNGWACPCHGSRYFIELDEFLRAGAEADGLGEHRGHTRRILRRRSRDARRDPRSGRQHGTAVAAARQHEEDQRQDVRSLIRRCANRASSSCSPASPRDSMSARVRRRPSRPRVRRATPTP